MKKLLAVFCVLAVCLTAFAACSTENGSQDSTAAGTATAKATATAAATEKATEKPTPTPTPEETGPKVDYSVYTIDVDITIIDGNAGIVFAGTGTGEFLMWQLAIGEKADGNLYFRPHEWVGGNPSVIEEIVVDSSVAAAEYNKPIHMQIKVNGETVVTSINGTEVSTLEVELTDFDMMGFRCDAYKDATVMEVGAFDNLVVTNSLGQVIFKEDFEGDSHYFSDYMDEEVDGHVENGQLVVGGVQKTLIMADMPSLKAQEVTADS